MATEKIMVAAPLDATEVEMGREYTSLPVHLNIFPWFDLPEQNWPGFDTAMRNLVADTQQPIIKGSDFIDLVPNEVVMARAITRAVATISVINGTDVHTGVHKLVRRHGGDFNPMEVGTHWQPTGHKLSLPEGEEVALPGLVVFRRQLALGARTVKAVYTWKAPFDD